MRAPDIAGDSYKILLVAVASPFIDKNCVIVSEYPTPIAVLSTRFYLWLCLYRLDIGQSLVSQSLRAAVAACLGQHRPGVRVIACSILFVRPPSVRTKVVHFRIKWSGLDVAADSRTASRHRSTATVAETGAATAPTHDHNAHGSLSVCLSEAMQEQRPRVVAGRHT